MSRDGRSHGLTRPVRRKLVSRRMGVLALAVTVPAMAAPSIQDAPEPQVIRFLMPETIPYVPPSAEMAQDHAPLADALPIADFPADSFSPGPAALSFALLSNSTDRYRAEQCLTMAVYYEAASESTDGQRAVAQVVMNRVSHPQYPNTVCGVVMQGSQRNTGCQFSFTCDGSLMRAPAQEAWFRAKRVARAAMGGFVFEPAGLATHYHTLAVNPYWAASLNPVATIGAHRFYRWRGAAGSLSAFQASYGGNEPLPIPNARTQTSAISAAPVPRAPSVAAPAIADQAIATPAASPVITADPQVADQLPASGSVREEYSQSGRWLSQP